MRSAVSASAIPHVGRCRSFAIPVDGCVLVNVVVDGKPIVFVRPDPARVVGYRD